uniref:hypothetical protein n=1 Tax=Microscilla sp. PRE1 TaxID=155537 RepID=UPI00146F704B|nr:hypothetical protein [Microscilla sp. PRE1]
MQGLDHKQIKFLAVCLELKAFAIDGRIPKKLINSNSRFRYYQNRLLENKIIKPDTKDKSGKYFLIRKYSIIWRLFGIQKSISKNRKYIKVFCRTLDIDLEVDGRKYIQEVLFQHISNTLAKQIKYVRNAGRRQKRNHTIEAPLSSATVAKLFGYKQPCTGSIKRNKYFQVSEEPLELVMRYIPDINPFRLTPRFKTKTVML